ncbi:MAG: HD domain-containing protein [Planctomycetota bacterium]|nr:HD domain-containing protein [Planctomycetota bacterium]
MPSGHPLLDALLALEPLHDLPRTGWVLRGIRDPESIGDHVLSTCFLVLSLGSRVEPRLDVERAVALALIHDVPEALIGDLPRTAARLLPAGAKAAAEDRAAGELLGPLSDHALRLWDEVKAGGTREARFVKCCDRLQLGLRLVAYHRAGHRGLSEFRETVAGLDCAEFPALADLRDEILAALGRASARE